MPGLNLLDGRALSARRTLYGECFTHDAVELRNPSANLYSRWVIEGEWKLIVPVPGRPHDEGPKEEELYRLTVDAGERTNLAAGQAARVATLRRKLDAWWTP